MAATYYTAEFVQDFVASGDTFGLLPFGGDGATGTVTIEFTAEVPEIRHWMFGGILAYDYEDYKKKCNKIALEAVKKDSFRLMKHGAKRRGYSVKLTKRFSPSRSKRLLSQSRPMILHAT